MKYIQSLTTGALSTMALSSIFFSSTDALAGWGDNQGWHMGPGMMGGWGNEAPSFLNLCKSAPIRVPFFEKMLRG